MSAQPEIGEWYRIRGGDRFEVVAVDDDDGTIEVQYFDGTVEELELDVWDARGANGEIEHAEAPENWTGPTEVEDEERSPVSRGTYEPDRPRAGGLEGLDLFDAPDNFT